MSGHYGPEHAWTRAELLVGLVADELRALEWSLGGGKGPRPEQVRPGRGGAGGETRHKGVAIPIDEFVRIFGIGEGEAWQRQ